MGLPLSEADCVMVTCIDRDRRGGVRWILSTFTTVVVRKVSDAERSMYVVREISSPMGTVSSDIG